MLFKVKKQQIIQPPKKKRKRKENLFLEKVWADALQPTVLNCVELCH